MADRNCPVCDGTARRLKGELIACCPTCGVFLTLKKWNHPRPGEERAIEALDALVGNVVHILQAAECTCDTSVGHTCEPCWLIGKAREAQRKAKGVEA